MSSIQCVLLYNVIITQYITQLYSHVTNILHASVQYPVGVAVQGDNHTRYYSLNTPMSSINCPPTKVLPMHNIDFTCTQNPLYCYGKSYDHHQSSKINTSDSPLVGLSECVKLFGVRSILRAGHPAKPGDLSSVKTKLLD